MRTFLIAAMVALGVPVLALAAGDSMSPSCPRG